MTKHLLDLHHVDELKNFAANNWDPRNWLVTYLETVHQKGNCNYKTSPIGYWGKSSTVGW